MQVSPSKYLSFFQTINLVFSEKGVRGFYGGLRCVSKDVFGRKSSVAGTYVLTCKRWDNESGQHVRRSPFCKSVAQDESMHFARDIITHPPCSPTPSAVRSYQCRHCVSPGPWKR